MIFEHCESTGLNLNTIAAKQCSVDFPKRILQELADYSHKLVAS